MLYLAKGKNKTKILVFFFSEKITFSSQSKALMGMRMEWELQVVKLWLFIFAEVKNITDVEIWWLQ